MQKDEMRNMLILAVEEDGKTEIEAYRHLMKVFGIGDVIETLQNLEKKRNSEK
ncbi:MAG: hypothetical protein IJ679_13155 [Lachnospiraceae bacterium]|nr:hypothetical protein [Lachnospiraceae bacterium]